MKINGNQVRKGHLLQYEGELWRVSKTEATKTGKSGAYNQVEMKSITSGTKKNVRFRASENVERARLDEIDCTFLYMEGDDAVVMDTGTYEQSNVPAEVLGDDAVFLDAYRYRVCRDASDATNLNLVRERIDPDLLLGAAVTEMTVPAPDRCGRRWREWQRGAVRNRRAAGGGRVQYLRI